MEFQTIVSHVYPDALNAMEDQLNASPAKDKIEII
jgi:hypothetical protein